MKTLMCAIVFASLAVAQNRTPIERAPESARSRPNPLAGLEPAARAGAKLYAQQCAACHGEQGQGMGSAPPLKQPRIRNAEPGSLYWVLKNGSMYRGMPSFAHLPEAQRWQIVTYLRNGTGW